MRIFILQPEIKDCYLIPDDGGRKSKAARIIEIIGTQSIEWLVYDSELLKGINGKSALVGAKLREFLFAHVVPRVEKEEAIWFVWNNVLYKDSPTNKLF